MTDIAKGTKLKKTVTNDRSAPLVAKPASSLLGNVSAAPQVPTNLIPPVPGGLSSNRARSSSDTGIGGPPGDDARISPAPQLGGIFAGVGIPKLRKSGGGIDTGRDESYYSDSGSSRPSIVKSNDSSTLKPSPPVRPVSGPNVQSAQSSLPRPSIIGKIPQRPTSQQKLDTRHEPNIPSSDSFVPKVPQPPPSTSKPPPPPFAWRKPSSAISQLASSANLVASAESSTYPSHPAPPPPIPPLASPPKITSAPTAAPPPPPATVPPNPPGRLKPTSFHSNRTPSNDTFTPSLAVQAARNAFGLSDSPAVPPPAPPPAPPMPPTPPQTSESPAPIHPYSQPPKPPDSRPKSHIPSRPMLDASSYTLSNGSNLHPALPSSRDESDTLSALGALNIVDSRWHFQDEGELPKPREFLGGPKKYRAGRGSSVPLKLFDR